MYDLFVSCIPQIDFLFIVRFSGIFAIKLIVCVLRLSILIPLYLFNLYCLISASIFYFNIKFHFLIHPEYSLQYVLMGRSIFQMLSPPSSSGFFPTSLFHFKATLIKSCPTERLHFLSPFWFLSPLHQPLDRSFPPT